MGRMKTKSIRIRLDTFDKLSALADANYRTFPAQLEVIVQNYVNSFPQGLDGKVPAAAKAK